MIGTTGLVSPVNIEAHAFEEAYISITDAKGATTDASAGQTGYNVAVIHPRTGRVVDVQGFDTVADPAGADSLAAYLRRGQSCIVAATGGAGSSAPVEALRGWILQDTRRCGGMAHAVVGVMGAAPGTAAEQIAPADAYVRVAGDFRTLAAALDWIEIGP
jgi:hypothetical protein